jgi:hypothetical protein
MLTPEWTVLPAHSTPVTHRQFAGGDHKLGGADSGCSDRLFKAYGQPLVAQRAAGMFAGLDFVYCVVSMHRKLLQPLLKSVRCRRKLGELLLCGLQSTRGLLC